MVLPVTPRHGSGEDVTKEEKTMPGRKDGKTVAATGSWKIEFLPDSSSFLHAEIRYNHCDEAQKTAITRILHAYGAVVVACHPTPDGHEDVVATVTTHATDPVGLLAIEAVYLHLLEDLRQVPLHLMLQAQKG